MYLWDSKFHCMTEIYGSALEWGRRSYIHMSSVCSFCNHDVLTLKSICIYHLNFFQPLTTSVQIFWLGDDVAGYWRTTTAVHAAALQPSTAVIWPLSQFWNSPDEVINDILFDEMSNEMKIGLIKHYQCTIHLEYYPKFPKTGTETCYFILIL
jgi:hypothetical protein